MQLSKFVAPEFLQPIPQGVGEVSGWHDTESPLFNEVEECDEPLVDIATAAPSIVGQPAYHDDPQYVRQTVASMLMQAQGLLPPDFQLVLLDGWRSLETQEALYKAEFDKRHQTHGHLFDHDELHSETQKYVSLPSQSPEAPSPHNTGGAVDVTIYYRGKMLDFGTDFDHMALESHLAYYEPHDLNTEARDSRRLLYAVMTRAGFEPYEHEWWHYNYGNQMAAMAQYNRTGERQKARYGSFVL